MEYEHCKCGRPPAFFQQCAWDCSHPGMLLAVQTLFPQFNGWCQAASRKTMAIKPPSVAEAQMLIHDRDLSHTAKKVIAAFTLMENCEQDPQVTLDDLLRCLDYGGTIAEVGARGLYVRTGRDG